MDLAACFAVLELTPTATEADVRQAYRDLVMVWHPDRFAHSPTLKAKAEQRTAQLSQAYAAIREHFRRSAASSPAASGSTASDAETRNRAQKPAATQNAPREACDFCGRPFRKNEAVYEREKRPACAECKRAEYSTKARNQQARSTSAAAHTTVTADRSWHGTANISGGFWQTLFDRSLCGTPELSAEQSAQLKASQKWMGIWWVPLIGGMGCLLIGLWMLAAPNSGLQASPTFSPFLLMDAPILLGLAFGMYRRSRVCFVLAVAYATVGLAIAAHSGRIPGTAWVAIFYAVGAFHAFRYHRLVGHAYRRLPTPAPAVLSCLVAALTIAALLVAAFSVAHREPADIFDRLAADAQGSSPDAETRHRPIYAPSEPDFIPLPSASVQPPAYAPTQPQAAVPRQPVPLQNGIFVDPAADMPHVPSVASEADFLTSPVVPVPTPPALGGPAVASATPTYSSFDADMRMANARRIERLGVSVEWQKYTSSQLLDMEMRIECAQRIKRLGVTVDWQQYSQSQLLGMEMRIECAGRIRRLGVTVDWQQYTQSQLLDMEMRIECAGRIRRLGVTVDWQQYTQFQLLDMEMRIGSERRR